MIAIGRSDYRFVSLPPGMDACSGAGRALAPPAHIAANALANVMSMI